MFSKPPELAGDDDRGLSIPPVWINDGDQSVCFDEVMIRLRIKGGIQRESRCAQIHANPMTKGNKIGEGFRQNRCIMCVDGFRRYRSDDESMIIGDRQFFFTFLVFVS